MLTRLGLGLARWPTCAPASAGRDRRRARRSGVRHPSRCSARRPAIASAPGGRPATARRRIAVGGDAAAAGRAGRTTAAEATGSGDRRRPVRSIRAGGRPASTCRGDADAAGTTASPHGPVPRRRHAAQAGRGRHVVADGNDLHADATRSSSGDTLTGIAAQVRRVDDDPLVGQPPQVEGRPQGRPDPDRSRRSTGSSSRSRPATRSTRSPTQLQVSTRPTSSRQRPRRSEPRRRPDPRSCPARTGKPIPTPKPRSTDRSSVSSERRRRRSAAVPRRTAAASSPGPSRGGIHQPVLPLRPLRARHRRRRTARRSSRPPRGTVIFAGWKNNGGGYQVWIAHGSGPVHDVQPHVGDHRRRRPARRARPAGRAGRQVRLATGPHLHFEVWRGPVWDGGTRVNPLGYL